MKRIITQFYNTYGFSKKRVLFSFFVGLYSLIGSWLVRNVLFIGIPDKNIPSLQHEEIGYFMDTWRD